MHLYHFIRSKIYIGFLLSNYYMVYIKNVRHHACQDLELHHTWDNMDGKLSYHRQKGWRIQEGRALVEIMQWKYMYAQYL